MSEVIDGITVVVLGMLAGNELAIAAFVHPSLWKLNDKDHASAAQPLARVTGRIMPFWYAATLALVVAVMTVRHVGALSWYLALAAAILVAGSVAFTLGLGLPTINNAVATWDLNAMPSDWKTQRRKWDRLHEIRVVIVILATLFLSAAVVAKGV
jgi:hypothetical protein